MEKEIIRTDEDEFYELVTQSSNRSLIRKGVNVMADVSADVIETMMDIPFIGSVLKLGKLGMDVRDYFFIRRVASFLQGSSKVSDEERQSFAVEVKKYGKEKKRKLASYLISLIGSVDDEEKATIMGWIYAERVKNHIDDDMMLRLCSVVNKCFLSDLKTLSEYQKVKVKNGFVSSNLFSLGLLEDSGIDGGSVNYEGGGTIYVLNEIGQKLYDILRKM